MLRIAGVKTLSGWRPAVFDSGALDCSVERWAASTGCFYRTRAAVSRAREEWACARETGGRTPEVSERRAPRIYIYV